MHIYIYFIRRDKPMRATDFLKQSRQEEEEEEEENLSPGK